jgi:hypothetical protein
VMVGNKPQETLPIRKSSLVAEGVVSLGTIVDMPGRKSVQSEHISPIPFHQGDGFTLNSPQLHIRGRTNRWIINPSKTRSSFVLASRPEAKPLHSLNPWQAYITHDNRKRDQASVLCSPRAADSTQPIFSSASLSVGDYE